MYGYTTRTRSPISRYLQVSNDVFERSAFTGNEAYSLSCLNATEFVLLNTFIETICPKMQNIHFRLTLVAQKRLCLNYTECILQLIDICNATAVNRPKCFKFFLGSYVIKFRQIHAPRTSQQFDPDIKIINRKYLMNFQLN